MPGEDTQCYRSGSSCRGQPEHVWHPGMPVDVIEPNQAHQPPHPFPVLPVALALQPSGYLACPKEQGNQVLVVSQLHESEVILRNSFRLVVKTGAADNQQLALAFY
jgi:hypothetical protein